MSNWTQWFNAGGFEWINHIGAPKKRKKKDPEAARQELLTLATQMKDQIYSEEILNSFRKHKLKLPGNFVVDNVVRLGVGKDEPEEVCIAGSGDVEPFVKWLEVNSYDFTIRYTY
jgi:hypothetical protein